MECQGLSENTFCATNTSKQPRLRRTEVLSLQPFDFMAITMAVIDIPTTTNQSNSKSILIVLLFPQLLVILATLRTRS